MSRAKVGDWVATFGKVVMLHGRSSLVIRVEGSEITVNRSECWIPEGKERVTLDGVSYPRDHDKHVARAECAEELMAWARELADQWRGFAQERMTREETQHYSEETQAELDIHAFVYGKCADELLPVALAKQQPAPTV